MLFRAEGVVTAAGSRHVQASCRAAGITLLRKICVGCRERLWRLEASSGPPVPQLLFQGHTAAAAAAAAAAAGTLGVKG